MVRRINLAGEDLIKSFEAKRLKAYLDGGGVPTIGWGHTKGVKMGQTIDDATAQRFFLDDLEDSEAAVSRLVKVPLNENQYAALVSFTFNCGTGALQKSTLLKRLNAGNYDCVDEELMKYVMDNGKKVKGLVRRRAAEGALWNKGQAPVNTSSMSVGKVDKGEKHIASGAAALTSSAVADKVLDIADKGSVLGDSGVGKYIILAMVAVGVGLLLWGLWKARKQEG